jgi:hypothetical protein
MLLSAVWSYSVFPPISCLNDHLLSKDQPTCQSSVYERKASVLRRNGIQVIGPMTTSLPLPLEASQAGCGPGPSTGR